MTAVVSTRCRRCGADLRDRFSRMLGYGPECRKTMTDAQLRAAMARNTPGHIPAERPRPASSQARHNHAEVARATAPVVADKTCPHEDRPASCALCRRDNDPWRAAERIIALIQRQRTAERDAAYEAWKTAHAPEPEQLALEAP